MLHPSQLEIPVLIDNERKAKKQSWMDLPQDAVVEVQSQEIH